MQPKTGTASMSRYRAALYIRLSKEDENAGPSQSVQNQEAMLRQFAAQHSLQIAGIYIDDGWSGTSFDRPGFRRMIADIEAGRVDLVVTKDLSRLSRDYILTGHYIERYFPEHGVRYISLLDGIDTGVDSTANDITPFRAILNDMYAKDISKKIKSVKHDKQRRGQFIGGKPVYGYKMHPTEKNRILPDEGAAPTVRRIFGMALGGASCRQIAMQLNAEGVPPPAVYAGLPNPRPGPYTGLWSSERISEMLRNETYLGKMVQGRSARVSYKSRKCRRLPPESWVVVEGTHEPLVDAETFRRVQQLLNSRRHTRTRRYDFLLKGLIFCHECGCPLAVINRKNAKGEDVLYFVCRTYQRFTKAGVCSCHTVKEQAVTGAVTAAVRALCAPYLDPGGLLPIAEEELRRADEKGTLALELRDASKRIAELNARLDRIYADRLSGLLAGEDFARIYEGVRQERARLEQRQKEIGQQKSPAPNKGRAEELVRQFMEGIAGSREVLVSLIERVELTGDKRVIIRFRFCRPEAEL